MFITFLTKIRIFLENKHVIKSHNGAIFTQICRRQPCKTAQMATVLHTSLSISTYILTAKYQPSTHLGSFN